MGYRLEVVEGLRLVLHAMAVASIITPRLERSIWPVVRNVSLTPLPYSSACGATSAIRVSVQYAKVDVRAGIRVLQVMKVLRQSGLAFLRFSPDLLQQALIPLVRAKHHKFRCTFDGVNTRSIP